MSDPIVSFDEAAMRGELELSEEQSRIHPERPSGGGGRDRRDRYERTAGREAAPDTTSAGSRPPGPGDQDAQAQGHEVHGDHRALRPVEEAMIEMYRRGLHQEDRGRLRDPGASVGIDGVEPQRQGVRGRRGVEEQAADPQVPLSSTASTEEKLGRFLRTWPMVAIGVNDDGYRERIGAAEGFTESAECWREFLSSLKGRGLLACACSPATRPPP